MRLERALLTDLGTALRSRAVLTFLGLQIGAGFLFVARRGRETALTVVLVWLAMGTVAFFAWWAGRHRAAWSRADPVPEAPFRAACALLAAAGLTLWGSGVGGPTGALLTLTGMSAWLWSAIRRRGWRGLPSRLLRDPRPFVPLLLLIAAPRLAQGGLDFVVGACLALPSGLGQQLLYLVGLFAPLEAVTGRTPVAAVASAFLFGLIHVPFNLETLDGDLLAAVANAVIFQASVGLIACLAFVRHRAVVPIGAAHALAIT